MTYYQKRNPLWMLIASVLLIPLFCLPPQEAASEKNRLEGHLGRERI